jgi:hypothetical protein
MGAASGTAPFGPVSFIVERGGLPAAPFRVYTRVDPPALLGLPSCLLFSATLLVVELCSSSLCLVSLLHPDQIRFIGSAYMAQSVLAMSK